MNNKKRPIVFSSQQTAKMFWISVQHLYRLVNESKVPHQKIWNCLIFFENEIKEYWTEIEEKAKRDPRIKTRLRK